MKFKIFLFLVLFFFISLVNLNEQRKSLEIVYDNLSQEIGVVQVFWDTGSGFKEEWSNRKTIKPGFNKVSFRFPFFKYPKKIRIDFFEKKNSTFEIQSINIKNKNSIEYFFDTKDFVLDQLIFREKKFVSISNDPKIILEFIPKKYSFFSFSYLVTITLLLIIFLTPNKKIRFLRKFAFNFFESILRSLKKNIANKIFFSIAILLLSVTLSIYPILFLNKSFDSPMGQALLSSPGSPNPTIPGFDDNESRYDNFRGNDTGAFAWAIAPNQVAAMHSVKEFYEFPYFNKYVGGGIANFAQANNLLLDPLNIFIYIFDGNSWGFDLKFCFSRLIYILGIFYLIKQISRSNLDAVIISVASLFIGYFHYRVQHPAIFSITYAPFLLFFWHKLKDNDFELINLKFLLFSLIIFFNFLLINSGPIKEVSAIALMVNLYGSFLILFKKPFSFQSVKKKFAFLFLLGFLIISAVSFNFILFLDYLSKNFSNYDTPSITQMPLTYMLGFFQKELLRYTSGFSSNIFFLFAIVYISLHLRTFFSSAKTLIPLIFFFINISLAYQIIPWQFLIKIPFLNNIHHLWDVFTFPAFLFLIVLTSEFIRGLRESDFSKNKKLVLRAAYIYLFLGALYFIGQYSNFKNVTTESLVVFLLTLFAILFCFFIPKRNTHLFYCLGGIFFINIFMNTLHPKPFKFLDNYLTQPMSRGDYQFESPSINFIKSELVHESFRVIGFSENESSHVLFPGFNTRLLINGIVPVDPIRNPNFNYFMDTGNFINANDWNWLRLLNKDTIAKSRYLLDKLNVKYIVSHKNVDLSNFDLTKVHSSDYDVWLNKSYWPKVFSTNIAIGYSNEKQLKSILKDAIKPVTFFDVNENLGLNNVSNYQADIKINSLVGKTNTALNYSETNNTISFFINANKGDLIVVNQNFYSNDYVFKVDNIDCKYIKINLYQLACSAISDGIHKVYIEYKPQYARITMSLTALALTISLIMFGFSLFQITRIKNAKTPR